MSESSSFLANGRLVTLFSGGLVTALLAVYSAGFYVGQSKLTVEVSRLSDRIAFHEGRGTHPEAVPRTEVQLRLSRIDEQLQAIRQQLERLQVGGD